MVTIIMIQVSMFNNQLYGIHFRPILSGSFLLILASVHNGYLRSIVAFDLDLPHSLCGLFLLQ
jgi:hypothetical protein